MAHQNCPNIAQVTIEMECDDQAIINDYFYEKPGGWVPAEMAEVANTFRSEWQSHMLTLYSEDVQFNRVVAVDLTSLSTERSVDAFSPGTTGTVTQPSAPNNVCWALTKATGTRGRGQQGRVFVGPIPETSVSSNSIAEVYANDYIAALQAVIDGVTIAIPTAYHVVLSRYHGVDANHKPIPRAVGIGLRVLARSYTNLDTDSQRDRLPGHKKHKAR